MYKMTFANADESHALYAADRETLERYAYRAEEIGYKIEKVE